MRVPYSYAKKPTEDSRYEIVIWHGEYASVATIVDTKDKEGSTGIKSFHSRLNPDFMKQAEAFRDKCEANPGMIY